MLSLTVLLKLKLSWRHFIRGKKVISLILEFHARLVLYFVAIQYQIQFVNFFRILTFITSFFLERESVNQQKTKRRQRQSNIIIRNEKKVHSILKRAKSENHINVPRYDELNIQNKEGISSKNKNDYLNSELGLFGSKEAAALDLDLSDIPRRPRSFTQTENYYQDHPSLNSFSDYGALRKLPHYGTMDKLDTSGLISHELNLDSKSNDQGDERPLSPDYIHEEDIKNFAAYFRQDSKSTTSSGSYSDEISSKCSGASWVDTVDGLRNNVRRDRGFSANDVFAVKHKIIVEG